LDTANPKRSVTILTPYARYYGGVEQVNQMLVALLEKEGFITQIISHELLEDGLFLKIKKRLFGLNRLLAHHFSKHYAAETNVVICNGEYSFGVSHPAAINIFHGCYHGYASAVRPYIPKKEYQHLMRLADQQKRGSVGKYVIAVSRTVEKILEDHGIHVDAVINNSVDTEKFRPLPTIARNDRCLFVGSSDYYGKGFDILEKLVDMGVKIDCVTSIRPQDMRLGWLGNIPNENLPEYYARYKAFLLPSRFEGSSLVPMEAMACRTPIVITAVGAGPDIAMEIPEFVVDGPWETIPEKIIERLRTIEERYEYFSDRARDYVIRHHGYEDWKRKWLNTIDLVQHHSGESSK